MDAFLFGILFDLHYISMSLFHSEHKHPETEQPIHVHVNVENVIVMPGEERPQKQHTSLVFSILKYQNLTLKNINPMSISLNVNEFVTSTLGLVDHVSQQPITDATFSNQTYVSDNSAIVTVDGSGTVTSVSAGTANITFTVDVAYTGTDGQPKTETGKTLVVAVTVAAVAQTTDLTVTFSTPAPVPTA